MPISFPPKRLWWSAGWGVRWGVGGSVGKHGANSPANSTAVDSRETKNTRNLFMTVKLLLFVPAKIQKVERRTKQL